MRREQVDIDSLNISEEDKQDLRELQKKMSTINPTKKQNDDIPPYVIIPFGIALAVASFFLYR
jgi:hypothetical protein